MKISKREQIMLLVLLLTFSLIAYYKLSFIPQSSKIKTLKLEKLKVEDKVQKTKLIKSEISKKTIDIKILNTKIADETIKLLPTNIIQEKLIVDLDELMKKNNINGIGLEFSEPKLTEFKVKEAKKENKNELKDIADSLNKKNSATTAKIQNNSSTNKIDIKYIPETMTATLTFNGSYANFIQFMKDIEQYTKRITLDDLNIVQDSEQGISGTVALCYYAIPKINDEDKEFLKWDFNNVYGKGNPFDGVILSNVVTTTMDTMSSITKVIVYDFMMSVRSINSDLPTFMLGKAKDDSKVSYLITDNPNMEPIEIQLIGNDGKYYYKYKSKKDSYPKKYDGEGVEFVPFSSSNINFKIYSAKRVDGNDNSGANVKIINKTDKKATINIENDDTVRPRVLISSEGDVDVVRK